MKMVVSLVVVAVSLLSVGVLSSPTTRATLTVAVECGGMDCGPNSECMMTKKGEPVCKCKTGYVYSEEKLCHLKCKEYSDCSPDEYCSENYTCLPKTREQVCFNACGANTDCDMDTLYEAVCTCNEGYIGNPRQGCYHECEEDSDCSPDKYCSEKYQCFPKTREQVCLNACGANTDCEMDSVYEAVCTCKDGYIGNPIQGCYHADTAGIQTTQPPTQLQQAINVQNSNQPGEEKYNKRKCEEDSDCSQDKYCSEKYQCVPETREQVCLNACGANTECEMDSVYEAVCTCKDGYIGNPIQGCYHECEADFDCSRDEYCSDNYTCLPMLREQVCLNACGANTDCEMDSVYEAVCTCKEGYIGNPIQGCYHECEADSDCSLDKYCSNNTCLPKIRDQVCLNACGANTVCDMVNFKPSCRCKEGYTGNPKSGCRLECEDYTECSRDKYCSNHKCVPKTREHVCVNACGDNTNCEMVNYRASCKCKEGYIGNPRRGCRRECEADFDCSRDKYCSDNYTCLPWTSGQVCLNACGDNTDCEMVNYRASCKCKEGYVGNPKRGCRHECKVHLDCGENKWCYKQKCEVAPIEEEVCKDACGANAVCKMINFKASCKCEEGYIGNPKHKCRHECDVHTDCIPGKYCKDYKCELLPTEEEVCRGACGDFTDCKMVNYEAVCACKEGGSGDPYSGCDPECKQDDECDKNQFCKQNRCTNIPTVEEVCRDACGPNTDCDMVNYKASCKCKGGYAGTPSDKYQGCRLILPRTVFTDMTYVHLQEKACSDGDILLRQYTSKHNKTTNTYIVSEYCLMYMLQLLNPDPQRPLVKKEYFIETKHTTWQRAWENCKVEGWDFANVQNSVEQEQLDSIIIDRNYAGVQFWLGANHHKDGAWNWAFESQEVQNFTNWALDQPQDGKNCMLQRNFKWYSADCGQSHGYICERKFVD